MDINDYKIRGQKINLKDFHKREISEEEEEYIREETLNEDVKELVDYHNRFIAQGDKGIVMVLQALDAAGKDEIIQYIFSHLTPQGLKVTSYGDPNEEEENHAYLWRMYKGMPEQGQIGILNRSYYEDVISPRVFENLDETPFPKDRITDDIWEKRYEHINHFEDYLWDNGFHVVKFFFNMSKDAQRDRFLKRLEERKHQHEFDFGDLEDRAKWDEYQDAFEDMLNNTSSEKAPWYILPADNPWLSRKIAVDALLEILKEIDPQYPSFDEEDQEKADKIIDQLKKDEI